MTNIDGDRDELRRLESLARARMLTNEELARLWVLTTRVTVAKLAKEN